MRTLQCQRSAPAIHAACARPAAQFTCSAPGVGTNVTRYAELVSAMSDGRMQLTVYGAGELVPPFSVEDAVQQGNVPVGHAPPYYAAG